MYFHITLQTCQIYIKYIVAPRYSLRTLTPTGIHSRIYHLLNTDVELVIDNAIAARRHRSSMFVEQYKCSYVNTKMLMCSTTAMAYGFCCDASIPVGKCSSPNRVFFSISGMI